MKVASTVIEALSKEVELFQELSDINSVWIDNFHNCNAEIMNVIVESDAEIKAGLITQIYGDEVTADDWRMLSSIDPKQVAWFGRAVNLIRFGTGYVGNGAVGNQLVDIECLALNFSYRAYWGCGENYMIRATVGRYLGRSAQVKSWPWPDWKGCQRNNQTQWLASAIATEMQLLHEFYDDQYLHQVGFLNVVQPKPPLRDFRAVLMQINEADAAEKAGNQNL